jgi:hypothetical protein
MSLVYTCPQPRCFTVQAVYPNVLGPAPVDGIFVACPNCQSVAVHHPHPSCAEAVRGWAARVVEVEVAMFRGQLDQGLTV